MGKLYEGEVKPIHTDANLSLYARPNMRTITYNLLIQKKKIYDIGVWSSADPEDTKIMVEKMFGRFYSQLLFVTYTKKTAAQNSSLNFFKK